MVRRDQWRGRLSSEVRIGAHLQEKVVLRHGSKKKGKLRRYSASSTICRRAATFFLPNTIPQHSKSEPRPNTPPQQDPSSDNHQQARELSICDPTQACLTYYTTTPLYPSNFTFNHTSTYNTTQTARAPSYKQPASISYQSPAKCSPPQQPSSTSTAHAPSAALALTEITRVADHVVAYVLVLSTYCDNVLTLFYLVLPGLKDQRVARRSKVFKCCILEGCNV